VARTELTPLRQAVIAAAWVLFIAGTCLAINARVGKTEAVAPLAGGALPPALIGTTTDSSTAAASATSSNPPVVTKTVTVAAPPPGVPVSIDIPFVSTHYPDGVHAIVTSNPLLPGGGLYVPDNPKTVSWANQDAAPGAARGTVILTSHVNFVVDGSLVIGAFADLTDYARNDVGKQITLTMADGRVMRYQIVAGREYNKEQLAGSAALRADLYNQSAQYGSPGQPRTSRLLLVSCGGAFDDKSGEYEDNVFLYALPVTSAGAAP
jgi:hypothetical protein